LQLGQFINFDFLSFSNSFDDANQLSKSCEQFLHNNLYFIMLYNLNIKLIISTLLSSIVRINFYIFFC